MRLQISLDISNPACHVAYYAYLSRQGIIARAANINTINTRMNYQHNLSCSMHQTLGFSINQLNCVLLQNVSRPVRLRD